MCHFSSYWGGGVPAIRDIIYCVFKTWKRGTWPLCSRQQESWKTGAIFRKCVNTFVPHCSCFRFFTICSLRSQRNHKRVQSFGRGAGKPLTLGKKRRRFEIPAQLHRHNSHTRARAKKGKASWSDRQPKRSIVVACGAILQNERKLSKIRPGR